MILYPTEQDRINQIILRGARMSRVTIEDIIKIKVAEWLTSDRRDAMLRGERYYHNRTDIQKKRVENERHSNAKLEHGFYRKLVDQKTGYLLSKPFSIKTDNAAYAELLNRLFGKAFLRLLKNMGKESVNKGIGWLYAYIDGNGALMFKKIPSHEVIPLWADADHTLLDMVIRVYEIDVYEGREKKTETKVEYYGKNGIRHYIYKNGGLIPDVEAGEASTYFQSDMVKADGKDSKVGKVGNIGDGSNGANGDDGNSSNAGSDGQPQAFNWTEIPFIAFKYNEEEQPLIDIIKSLVDDYNLQASTNADLLADIPLFIYIIKNYGGADLKEFLNDLRDARAVKVRDDGGVDKLTAEPTTDALRAHLEAERRAIYEFGRGVDTQSDSLGNASGVALKFRYADLDMDANNMDTEFQASFEKLLWFVNQYFILTGQGDFTGETVGIVFNRDIIISESDVINDCQTSKGVISDKTIMENHPWVDDVEIEIKRIAAEEMEIERKNASGQYPGLGDGANNVGVDGKSDGKEGISRRFPVDLGGSTGGGANGEDRIGKKR